MKPIERFQALLDGKKIRKYAWREDIYIKWTAGLGVKGEDGGGVFLLDDLMSDKEKWEIYEEPKAEIKLTPEDVGKRVRLMNGVIALIVGFDINADSKSRVAIGGYMWTYSITGVSRSNNNDLDIVEVLK